MTRSTALLAGLIAAVLTGTIVLLEVLRRPEPWREDAA